MRIKQLLVLGLPWIVWLIASSFYFHQYFLRNSFSAITPELKQLYALEPNQVANAAAVFFYTFVAMQLVAGVLIDKYGAKIMLSLAAFISGVSCFLMGYVDGFAYIMISRVLLALGASLSLICVLTLVRTWFSKRLFPLLNGITAAIGMLGAFVGEGLLSHLMTSYRWQEIIIIAGVLCFTIMLLVLLFVHDKPNSTNIDSNNLSHRFSFKLLFNSINNVNLWYAFFYCGLIYVIIDAYGSLWAGQFLQSKYSFSSELSQMISSTIFIGVAVGSIVINGLVMTFKRVKVFMLSSVLFLFFIIVIIIYTPGLSQTALYFLHLLLGFFAGSATLAFVYVRDVVPKEVLGTSISILEFFKHLFSAIGIQIIGVILTHEQSNRLMPSTAGLMVQGQLELTGVEFEWGLLVIPIAILLAIIMSLIIEDQRL